MCIRDRTKTQSIFDDMVGNVGETDIRSLVTALAGRPLRVGTVCSGTESPVMALHHIAKAAHAHWGVKLMIEHAFSCEIEPAKQAYIETNFRPPVLFRDVTELPSGAGTTAYGAIKDVPQGVDLLIAGTSCVDNSNLNAHKKRKGEKLHGVRGQGESADTFNSTLKLAAQNGIQMVMFENVCGCLLYTSPSPRD